MENFFPEVKQKLNNSENITEVKEPFKPIRAVIVDNENIDSLTKNAVREIKKNGTNIDYFTDRDELELQDEDDEQETHVISQCDSNDKFSCSYYNCTGAIIIGTDKNGKEISIMSHQDPYTLKSDFKESFKKDLFERIEKLKEESDKKSLDAIIFGGNLTDYEVSIKTLSEILKEKLDFEPTVMTGPNLVLSNPTDVYLDTQNRRLYIVRPFQNNNKTNHEYAPSQIEEKSKEW